MVIMLLTTAPVLAMPNFKKPFIIHVDASDLGVGAVLMQEDVHKLEHPICYFSRKFNNAQRNYSTSKKEVLGLILLLKWSLELQEYTLNIHHISEVTMLSRMLCREDCDSGVILL